MLRIALISIQANLQVRVVTENHNTGYIELGTGITRKQDISQISYIPKSKQNASLTLVKRTLTGNSPYSIDLHAGCKFSRMFFLKSAFR